MGTVRGHRGDSGEAKGPRALFRSLAGNPAASSDTMVRQAVAGRKVRGNRPLSALSNFLICTAVHTSYASSYARVPPEEECSSSVPI